MADPTSRGLLVDYGGVLTSSMFGSFARYCQGRGVESHLLVRAFREDEAARRALIDFETGRATDDEFEAVLASRLGLEPAGLLAGLVSFVEPERDMLAAVAAARAAGVRTGLLSNSWGENAYDRTGWDELFDVTVISGEVGMRKPDPAIYALAAERLGLEPAEVVFVDDLPHNLEPAREAGMAVVHHVDAATTIAELERLLGIALR